MRIGMEHHTEQRIAAGVRYVLSEAANNGHTYLPEEMLAEQARVLLNVDSALITRQLSQMQIDRLIYRERVREANEVYLNAFYYAERNVAKKLTELAMCVNSGTHSAFRHDTEQAVLALERENEITLSDGQRAAVVSAVVNGVMIITGGPGTGKTTAINIIISLLQRSGFNRIVLTAPTGRAAKRMAEATGREARTIHRLLETTFLAEDARRQTFNRNEENPLETDAVIVDETSMVDILLMQHLLKAIPPGARLILVGDVDQLPSVGPGNVLKDMISGGTLPVARLTEIFRQAQESAIIMNAHRINRGEYPLLNEKNRDFFFLRRNRSEDIAETLADLLTRRLPKYLNGTSAGIQVLTPMRKSALGVAGLNQLLQRRLNPPSPDKKEREYRSVIFREGDKVMQIKNNYDASWVVLNERNQRTDEGEGVFNGDCGVIAEIDEANEIITVQFDDNRRVEYDFTRLEELELAYAVTIHKSQGSEYPAVVIPLFSGPPMLLSRNLLYTAVTRARSLAVIVGLPETLYRLVDTNREVNRYTSLARRLRQYDGA
jgi:exodeoxyribonuclease V alpha subunit